MTSDGDEAEKRRRGLIRHEGGFFPIFCFEERGGGSLFEISLFLFFLKFLG